MRATGMDRKYGNRDNKGDGSVPSHRQYRVIFRERVARAPSWASLIVAALLLPAIVLAWLIFGGLLLLIGAGVLSLVLALALGAALHRRLNGRRVSKQSRVIDADYQVVEDKPQR